MNFWVIFYKNHEILKIDIELILKKKLKTNNQKLTVLKRINGQ